jgi:hypothetical protein
MSTLTLLEQCYLEVKSLRDDTVERYQGCFARGESKFGMRLIEARLSGIQDALQLIEPYVKEIE